MYINIFLPIGDQIQKTQKIYLRFYHFLVFSNFKGASLNFAHYLDMGRKITYLELLPLY